MGQDLTIPEVKTNQNDSTTYKPYNSSEIAGSTTPGLRDWSSQQGGVVGGRIGKIVSDRIGLTEGFALGATHMVTGTVNLAISASDLANPATWVLDTQRNLDHVTNTYRTLDTFDSVADVSRWATNPVQSLANAKALINGVTQDYRKDLANGDSSKAWGRGVFEIVSAVGPLAAGKLGKAGELAKVAENASVAARTTEEAGAATRLDQGVAGGVNRGSVPNAEAAVGPKLFEGFSVDESRIINEAQGVIDSPQLAEIQNAHAAGEPLTVSVNGRLIQYEPDLPASGMTMFGENGFLIGREAFSSPAELQKTILHELYRLNMSESASGVSSALATQETQAAADFAARAHRVITQP